MMLLAAGEIKITALQLTLAVVMVLGPCVRVEGGLIVGRIRRHIATTLEHRTDRTLYCSYTSALDTQASLATQRLEGYTQLRFPGEVIEWDLYDAEVAALRDELGDPTLTPLERMSLLYEVSDDVMTEKLAEDPASLSPDVARNRTRMLAAMDELFTTMNNTIRLYRSRAEETCHCSDVVSGIVERLMEVRLEFSPAAMTVDERIKKYIRVMHQVIRLINVERRRHMHPHCRSL